MSFTIAVHGGAGTILKEDMTPALEAQFRHGLRQALQAGFVLLQNGGSAVDAVLAATEVLEDDILFNAGRGSVFTKKGLHEMDASVMNGLNLEAGAVCGVHNLRNPIRLAAAVMNNSDHVMLSGEGAVEFGLQQGFQLVPDEYFYSRFRHDQWVAMRDSNDYALDHSAKKREGGNNKKFGTVGAVACDAHGHIAAATSTGGMTNKSYGRVGDTPLIGCGTYANDKTCAISCTGHGELFIRAVTAYDVSCLMEYRGLSLQEAMQIVVHEKLVAIKGEGGMIGVDAKGNYAMLFNSEGMYRGVKRSDGAEEIAIYK